MVQESWKEYLHKDTGKIYLISNLGNAKSKRADGSLHEHSQYKNNGYRCIPFRKRNGKKGLLYLHKIIAELFVENPNNYTKLHFVNGNSENCQAHNLKWISAQKAKELNQQQTKPYDIYPNYAPHAKLSVTRVALIKKKVMENEQTGKTKWAHMAKQFGISPRHLWQIRKGIIWSGVKVHGQ